MNNNDKELLLQLLDKYGKDLLSQGIDDLLNPKDNENITIGVRGRPVAKYPRALTAIYRLVLHETWINGGISITKACKSIIKKRSSITFQEDENKSCIFYAEVLRKWFYAARKYKEQYPDSHDGQIMINLEKSHKNQPSAAAYAKEMESIKEMYKL